MVARKARQSKVQLFFWRDVNLAFDGVVRIVQLRFKGSTFGNLEGLERFVGVPILFIDLMPQRAYGSCLQIGSATTS